MRCVDKLDRNDEMLTQREAIWEILNDKDNHWNQFIKSMWTDIDDNIRNAIFENLIIRSFIIGNQRQKQSEH